MNTPVNGLQPYIIANKTPELIATWNSGFYRYNGVTTVAIPSTATVDSQNFVAMVQATDKLWGTDLINVPFKYDGSGVNPIDTSKGLPNRIDDMVYLYDRMYWAAGDLIYVSAIGDPENILVAPLEVKKGGGDKIIRMISFRAGLILVFKSSLSGQGSIHILDVSANDPDFFSLSTLFDQISVISPRSVVRTGNDQDTDVIFATREGLRSIRFTALDKLTNPPVPLSLNDTTHIAELNYNQMQLAHSIVFDDEVFWFVPNGVSSNPNWINAYSLKVPKSMVGNGFTAIDFMSVASAAVIGFNNGKPGLYYGDSFSNQIKQAFINRKDALYQEISKRITYNDPHIDKVPVKFILDLDQGTSGTISAFLLFEDDEERPIGQWKFDTGGFDIPFDIPFDIRPPKLISKFVDLRWDSNGVQMRRGKDIRVKITSNDFPAILGYVLQCHLEPKRYLDIQDDQTQPIVSAPLQLDATASSVLPLT